MLIGLAVATLLLAAAVARPGTAPLGPAGPIIPVPVPSGAAVLVGAGDVARCGSDGDEATARLLDAIEGTVFTAGDNAYERGTAAAFRDCYGPTWGRHLDRTLPAAGNHDWDTTGAAGYRDWFGARAGPDGRTWYATDVGTWRVIVLDSNCAMVGGCGDGSAQLGWLLDELSTRPARCTVAIWHHPRFSSGAHGSDGRPEAFWRALHVAGAEIVVNGHDHDYERFAPQDPAGRATESGIRQFVVGTGGTELRSFGRPIANSEVRDASTHGVLRLVLRPDRYEWQFVPVAGGDFRDEGGGTCR
jgi:hypothetical protein